MMTYQDFITRVERNIMSYLPDSAKMSVEIREVCKNNGITLQGLTIKCEDANIAPTIYLEQFYEELSQGGEFSEIMSEIAATYENHKKGILPGFSLEELDNGKVFGELVNTERNLHFLKDIPSVPVFGGVYSVIFKYQVNVNGVNGSINITDDIASTKGLTTDELYKLALTNKGEQYTPKLESIGSVLSGMLGMDFPVEDGLPGIYVLTNETTFKGAFVILRPETQELLKNSFDGDLIVIPSSIHELLLIPSPDNFDVSAINSMIQEVNRTVVSPQEILGDEYFVLRRTNDGYSYEEQTNTDDNTTLGSSLG